ncbi:MAG: hypothetical protein ABSA47_07160 [Verrucomicrobiota bacterium]|jgi:hypothetical protein
MKSARHIVRDGYQVIDWPDQRGLFITDLWQKFPELVLGMYLVNTSFDSGFLTLSDSERIDGWRMIGRLAHSPKICAVNQIPHDQFDEWLVFDQPTQVEGFETMVNYGGFSPIDFTWEEKRERYWKQVVRLQPLHVIAENDAVYLISRDKNLIAKILESDLNSAPQSGRF